MSVADLVPLSSNDRLKIQYLKQTISDDDLLLDLIRLQNEFGENLTENPVNSKGNYSIRLYQGVGKVLKMLSKLLKIPFLTKS